MKKVKRGKDLISLRKAGKIDDFIAEHESDEPGDMDKLDAALKRPASGKSSATQEALKPDDDGGCT